MKVFWIKYCVILDVSSVTKLFPCSTNATDISNYIKMLLVVWWLFPVPFSRLAPTKKPIMAQKRCALCTVKSGKQTEESP